jgi:hypothetical protein
LQETGLKRRRKRQRQLDAAMATIQRRFGPRALVQDKPASAAGGVPTIPTGFPALDHVLGIGGLPRAKVCELVGPATSGKTTLALKLAVRRILGKISIPPDQKRNSHFLANRRKMTTASSNRRIPPWCVPTWAMIGSTPWLRPWPPTNSTTKYHLT